MAKKKSSTKKFQPFIHENLEIKNELLQMARNAKAGEPGTDKKLENDLASVLIYSNMAEYLAENLLETLNHFVKESTYKDFGGILYIENVSSNNSRMTLGSTIKQIEKFSFPDKEKILCCFRKISESRNRLFHNFAKSDINTITDLVGKDLPVIQDECEEVITRINTVYAGLQKILAPQTTDS